MGSGSLRRISGPPAKDGNEQFALDFARGRVGGARAGGGGGQEGVSWVLMDAT